MFDLILRPFWWPKPENCSLGADKRKIENLQFSICFSRCFWSRPFWNELKIHQNPLLELTFFEIKNRLEIWSILSSKTTSKSTLKTYYRSAYWLLGTSWGPLGELLESPGAEIDHFGSRFGSIFDPQSIKFDENLVQNRRIKRPRSGFRAIL